MNPKIKHKIILFDGVCNLCNSSVNLIIKHDKKDVFRFASLQSDFGQNILSKFNLDSNITDSIVLIDGNHCYIKSSAALRISKNMSGFYPLLFGFIIIPTFIRNWVYDYVAKNRYKWYGKKESCMIPTLELQEKFYS